ncbi:enoyl-CoA hydratase-related protein [Myxococcus sp. 1LA]
MLTLTFNRSQKKNAFSGELDDAAAQALLDAGRNEEVRGGVLTGAGDNFTSGNDIKDFLQKPPDSEDNPFHRFMRAISRFEKPIVAGVDGVAVGVGTTMLLHCDYVVASARAVFSLPSVNLGLCPEGASSVLLPRLAGMSLASEVLMSGDSFDAATALRARIVHQVVPENGLAEVVSERATALASKPVEALRLTKRLLREPLRAEVDVALQREGKHLFERIASAEAQAVFAAFLGGRK